MSQFLVKEGFIKPSELGHNFYDRKAEADTKYVINEAHQPSCFN